MSVLRDPGEAPDFRRIGTGGEGGGGSATASGVLWGWCVRDELTAGSRRPMPAQAWMI